MRVACLVPYPLDFAPSQRFRLEQWAPTLAGRGIRLEFVPLLRAEAMNFIYKPGRIAGKAKELLRGCAARIRWAIQQAPGYDVVVIHREALFIGVDWIERYVASHVPTVFDFDDAVWLPNVSNANQRFAFLKGFAKVDRILGVVSSVSAGCEHLAAHARRFNENVVIVPTSIDVDKYAPARTHENNEVLTVGWTGSTSTAAYMQFVVPVLRRAAERFPIRFRVLGADLEISGVDVMCEPWTPEREVPFLRALDVGLKPSPRNDWVKGKCPMKDIQYMALGVPPVATRFGTAPESIADGVSGFLCDTDDEWLRALDRLRDVDLRRRMGAAARRVVEERYSTTVAAARFEEALHAARRQFGSSATKASA